jgi:uncharacterized protein
MTSYRTTRRMFFHWIATYPLPIAGAVLVLLALGGSWVIGGLLVMPAHRKVAPPPSDLNAVDITLASMSGARIHGWWCEKTGSHATILLFHGVRGDRRTMLGRAKLFRDAGFSVLLIDFQAHGESRGSHISFGHLERHDVSASLDFVRQKYPAHLIGVVGSSLGGASTLLGAPREIDALVLESVYPTIDEAVDDRTRMRLGPFGFILTKLLLLQIQPRLGISPAELRPIDKIAQFTCPILIISGDKDRHTTLPETKRLFACANEPKELVVFQGAAHIDLLEHDQKLYEEKVLGFFQRLFATPRDSKTTPSVNSIAN